MKVALLADVHANLHALEAVLAHAQQQQVEALWNLGDFVGYSAFPDEVVQVLRATGAISIIGNYDRKVLRFRKKATAWQKAKRPEKWLAFQWAYENLSSESRTYLGSLPKEARLEVAGYRILLVHGSPVSDEEVLTRSTPEARLRELAEISAADVIVCGHSHQSFARRVGGIWFINPGSAGRPDDGDVRVSYAVLQIARDQLEMFPYRIDYDVPAAVSAIRERHLPEVFAQMLLLGRDFNTAMAHLEAGGVDFG